MVDSASVPQVSFSSVARRNSRTIILISARLYSVMLCSTKFCIFLLGYCDSELGMLSLLVTSPNPVLHGKLWIYGLCLHLWIKREKVWMTNLHLHWLLLWEFLHFLHNFIFHCRVHLSIVKTVIGTFLNVYLIEQWLNNSMEMEIIVNRWQGCNHMNRSSVVWLNIPFLRVQLPCHEGISRVPFLHISQLSLSSFYTGEMQMMNLDV